MEYDKLSDQQKRSLRNLIYRMRKVGYVVDRKQGIAIMSKDRHRYLERHIQKYNFTVQYPMFAEQE